MSRYDNYTREELIHRIEELETRNEGDNPNDYASQFVSKILKTLPDMLTVIDRNGTIVELISDEQTNHVGLPLSQVVGHSVREVVSEEASEAILNNMKIVFETQKGSTSHHDITVDGVTRNYENRIFPLNEDHVICMCRDITEAAAAQRRYAMLQYALNRVDEKIYACTAEGRMIYANGPFLLHHKIKDDVRNHMIFEFWSYGGTEEQWKERLEKIRQGNGQYEYTVRFKNEHGNIVAWDVIAYLILDSQTKKERIWFFSRNVTQRIEHENKVREMNFILDCIMNNVPVYLYVKDPANDFRYLYWNRGSEKYTHIPAAKAIGHTDYELFPNRNEADRFRQCDLELLRTGARQTTIGESTFPNGETRIFSTTQTLAPVENRMPLIIGMMRNITEQKRSEAEIIEAREHAENADRQKSAFLANMSHEIRTPLNAIVGFAKLMASAETDDERQQYDEIIDANSKLLLQLINDILDLSKIEAGTLDFHYSDVNVNELCVSESEVMKLRINENVQLIFDREYEVAQIETDRNRLTQVLTNLIGNAAKFTSKGEIRFGFKFKGEMIDFFVSDTGIGIAEEKLPKVFERFVKLNDYAVGTGLGLAISKIIVEHMGGTIGVESQLGVGTCFHFSIPVKQKKA